uniref:Uncharacterized protein n=1 Tax=Oryza meridionalis TaxID=40149 RepID=A0A0E0DPN2_9ORYZ
MGRSRGGWWRRGFLGNMLQPWGQASTLPPLPHTRPADFPSPALSSLLRLIRSSTLRHPRACGSDIFSLRAAAGSYPWDGSWEASDPGWY